MAEDLDTRARIKIAARKLFAERGLEAVTVREIVAEAGARNGGSLNYYFESKEGLIAELLADVLRTSSEAWSRAIVEAEKTGGLNTVRDVVAVVVYGGMHHKVDDPHPTSTRFLASVLFTRRRVVRELMNQLDYSVFVGLLATIQRLRPDIPAPVMRQRLIFLAWYLISVQSALEAFIARGNRSREWSDFDPLINIIDTAAGLVEAPISNLEDDLKRWPRPLTGAKPAAARRPRTRKLAAAK